MYILLDIHILWTFLENRHLLAIAWKMFWLVILYYYYYFYNPLTTSMVIMDV